MKTESMESLLKSADNISPQGAPIEERPLTSVEKTFLLLAERGDCASVRKLIKENQNDPSVLNVNCVDPLNRSALIAAIENENIELIKLLLFEDIQVKDGLLHAIKEEYVEAVELLLDWEEKHHKMGTPYSWEAMDHSSSTFTNDITPLILAAHKNNYEIIKILLDRGATLPMPHDVRCGCDQCIFTSEKDSLRHSQSRINAYRALSSPSLIALSSKDPLLTAFELSWELRRLSRMETEFRTEYNDMRNQCQIFATSLLDHVRTSHELEVMLNYNPTAVEWDVGEKHTLERIKLAIKYKQKMFVAHPNVQQLLASIWYEGLPGFRRKGIIGQMFQVAQLGAMFPVYSSIHMMFPTSEMGLFMKKPFVKFICHSTSYAFFLMLLGLASQRAEFLVLEWFGTSWMRALVEEWKEKERGAGPGLAEYGVILYVFSLIWSEIRSLWSDGIEEYIADLWNIVDFITNVFYLMWLCLRMSSWYIVQREAYIGKDPWYPREQWDPFDPMLLSEGAFAAGMIFSFLKLVHIFSVNPHLGPLQISLGRMIIDIIKFFFIYTLVLFAFGCGLNQLLWYYAELEKNKCYHLPNNLPDFENHEKACGIWRRYANLFETSQSLFWASFGLVDLMTFELTGIKSFTRFWALLMFGSYSVINVIVLLNMLIAMMSNSYQIISERADIEWKFARSRLWISYFEEGDTVPPPFNLIPTAKTFNKVFACNKGKRCTQSVMKRSRENAAKWHDQVMKLLVRRYVTAEQRKRDDFGITEDDVMEIRQDISTLRYELIDILRQNGMTTPKVSLQDTQMPAGKKGRVMERRLLTNFHIGIVEGLKNESMSSKKANDVFTHLAKVIARRTSSKKKKKDWNTLVRSSTHKCDQIGSAREAQIRQIRRQSLREHIIQSTDLQTVDQDKLLEYNPKLSNVPPTARLAYAKFMTAKIKQDFITGQNEEKKPEDAAVVEVTAEPKIEDKAPDVNKVISPPVEMKTDSTQLFDIPEESGKSPYKIVEKTLKAKESVKKETQKTHFASNSITDKAQADKSPLVKPAIKLDNKESKSVDSAANKSDSLKKSTESKKSNDVPDNAKEKQPEETKKVEPKPKEVKKIKIQEPEPAAKGHKAIIDGKSKVSGNVRTGWI